MKTKPIIFSGPMIKALLEGRKTQTRRALKLPRESRLGEWEPTTVGGDGSHYIDGWPVPMMKAIWHTHTGKCVVAPLQVGDFGWAREAWQGLSFGDYLPTKVRPCDLRYKATDPLADANKDVRGYPWRPSIHMPRWASRLTLEVTDVRVERVQDISEADAIAEGMTEGISYPRYLKSLNGPRCAFMALWNSIHGPDAWQRNDWIAAYSFTVHHRNVDDLLAEREVAA